MSAVDTKFYEKKKNNLFFGAVIFFIVMLALTLGVYIYNMKLQTELDQLRSEFTAVSEGLETAWKDEILQAYRLYERNKKILERKSCESHISSFVGHLKKNISKFWLQAEWFTYNKGKISTDISVVSDSDSKAYQKIVNFFTQYPEDDKAFFVLHPALKYGGYERIEFSQDFTLNTKFYEECKQK